MMYFILVTDPRISLRGLKTKLTGEFRVDDMPDIGLAIQDNGQHAWIRPPENLADEYPSGELASVDVNDPRFFVLQFRSIDLVKRILSVVAKDPLVWVDLDNPDYPILPGPDLVTRMGRDPSRTLGVQVVP